VWTDNFKMAFEKLLVIVLLFWLCSRAARRWRARRRRALKLRRLHYAVIQTQPLMPLCASLEISPQIIIANGLAWLLSLPHNGSIRIYKQFCSGKGSPPTITEILGVTRQALYNRIRGCTNPEVFSDLHLDWAIWSITGSHPNDGEVMVDGHLTRGKCVPHAWLRASMHWVYPEGVSKKGVLSSK